MDAIRVDAPRPRTAGRAAPVFRLRRRVHKAALTAHVLSSVGWFGAALVVAFCGIAATATSDPTLAPALHRTIEASLWLTVPAGLLAFATGTLLGLGTTWGLIRHWWVVAKLGINLVVVVTDLVVVAPTVRDVLAGEEPGQALFGPTIAHCVMLGVATGLSVFKPRGRTPRGKRVEAQT